MSKKLISEKEVKNSLSIDNFCNISKDKMKEFISLIPTMDKELAKTIINQFPKYVEFATTAITTAKNMCDSILKNGETSQIETINLYKTALEGFCEDLKKDNLSQDERNFISERIIFILNEISKKDTEYKNFLSEKFNRVMTFIVVTFLFGVTVLGINLKSKPFALSKK